MKAMLAAGGAMLMTMACATVPPGEDVPEIGDPRYQCNAEGLGDLVGRQATQELGADALRRSNSRSLRWIRPGDAVTMDYRPDRLNIHLDARGRVERFNCG
jgi:hypothetical protein